MGMFDKVGNLQETSSNDNYNMPVGDHPALITNVEFNEELEVVDFKINFLGTSVAPRGRFWLGGNDPVKVKKGHAMIAKQLKSVFGNPIRDGKEMEEAILALDGKHVVVEVTPRKGSNYQNYWLKGAYTLPRGADVNPALPDSDTDLLF